MFYYLDIGYRRGISLTHGQARRLLTAAEKYPDIKLRVLLALGFGLRHGEIFNLKLEDVNFSAGTITIYRLKKRRKEAAILKVPADILDMIQYIEHGRGDRAGYVFRHQDCEKRFKDFWPNRV